MGSELVSVENGKPEEHLLQLSSVEGELRLRDAASPMRWSVTIGRHGGISLAFESVDLTQETAWLFKAGFPEERVLQRLRIRGKTDAGVVVESDDVYLLGQQTKSDKDGTKLILTGDASRLRLLYTALPETSDGVRVVYLTVGMRAFGRPSVETSLGQFILAAPTTLADPDHVCGQVHVHASREHRLLKDWLADADRVVGRILDMVSFAEGGLIRWSVRQIESERGVLAIDCEGPKGTGPAFDGVFHHLHLQPVLDLAIKAYTEELCEKTGLAVALEWFVHHPRYSELQLISAMTALEHLVSVYEERNGSPTILNPEMFAKVSESLRPTLEQMLKDEFNVVQAVVDRMDAKLTQINNGNFRDKLEAMLRAYGVPLAGLDLKEVNNAVAARNRVVHRGLYKSGKDEADLQQQVAVLRELLKRIFLALLRYNGEYFSLMGGPKWAHFPPASMPEAAALS